MVTNADIITRSLRKLNAVPLGATPDPAELSNALSVLRAFYIDVFDQGGYGPIRDVAAIGATYAASPQQRIAAGDATVVSFPANAPVRSAIEVDKNTSRFQTVWDGGAWQNLETITTGSVVLLPGSMHEELASYLAVALSADYAQTASDFDRAQVGALQQDITAGVAAPRAALTTPGTPLVSDIIRGALSKLKGRGANSIGVFENQLGLETLRGLFQEWAAQGAFGAMWDGISSASPMPNVIGPGLRMRAENNPKLLLPDRVERWFNGWSGGDGPYDYGWRFWPVWPASGEVRPPRDLSVCVVANPDGGDSATYLYDGQAGTWVNVSKLSFSSVCPLAQKHSETLKAALAVRIADDLGVEVKATTVRTAQMGLHSMSARWDSPREPVGEFY